MRLRSLLLLPLFCCVALAASGTPGLITVKPGDTLYRLSRVYGVSPARLRELNGLEGSTIRAGQVLRVRPAPTPASRKPGKAAPKRYAVQSGDTLGRIARRHGLSLERLKALNGLRSDDIRAGQVLRLSGALPVARPTLGAKPKAVSGVYTVRAGDTLGGVAIRVGSSVAALQRANGLRGTVIRVGQKLRLPDAPTAQATRAGRSTLPPGMEVRTVYTYVRVGRRDTPERLAARYHLTVGQLRRLNRLDSRREVVPGLKLLVPQRVPVPRPPRPQGLAVRHRQLTLLNVPLQVVDVDLRHRDVLVAPVLPGAGERFESGARVGQLARRSGARALINGSYFHPRSYAPAGDIVMQGRMLTWGRIPMALAITPDNRAAIRASTTPALRRPLDTTWAGMETVVATGPRIVANGAVFTRYSRAFQDPAIFGRAARSAIGLRGSRDLLLVSTHARLTAPEMGRIMARLGARDALLLDGGSSAGLAWNGRAVLDSVRKVSYGIGVFTDYAGRRYLR